MLELMHYTMTLWKCFSVQRARNGIDFIYLIEKIITKKSTVKKRKEKKNYILYLWECA